MSNTFGQLFRLTTFGESHGPAVGGVIDGCPAGMILDIPAIQHALNRRRPGQSALTTQRKEADRVTFLSGLYEGQTTGTPLAFQIPNQHARSQDYDHLERVFRPSHADYTYTAKYGLRDPRGGGRASARETASWVVGGAVGRQILDRSFRLGVTAFVESVGPLAMPDETLHHPYSLPEVDAHPVRCPHPETAEQMEALIREVRKAGDTVGGVVRCRVQGVPIGWGEPIFDKLHARLAHAMLTINAAKGFEYGSGFTGTTMRGSEHNDLFTSDSGRILTTTNYSGGIQGGISNGMDIYFRVAFKPVATLMRPQQSVDIDGNQVEVEGRGRHDPCVVPRAVPIVEAMTWLVLADMALLHRAPSRSGGGADWPG